MMHLGDWTSYWAQRAPTAEAIVEPTTGRRWSYRDLDRRAGPPDPGPEGGRA